jgi:hypothetical protein
MERFSAPAGPPMMSTLQVAALRERGRLPQHCVSVSLLPTAAAAAVAPKLGVALGYGGGAASTLAAPYPESRDSSGGRDGGRGAGPGHPSAASITAAVSGPVAPGEPAAAYGGWGGSPLATPSSAKAAAAVHRSGRGAASCLQYSFE